MKISQEEIDAAHSAWCDTEGSRNELWTAVIKAALIVRKRRKAAKRERQRKEKDKQVVESVKPAQIVKGCGVGNPFDNSLIRNQFTPNSLMSALLEAVAATPSKAPEWDGTFGVGEWEMRNGEKATIRSVSLTELNGTVNGHANTWPRHGRYLYQSQMDLIRPWPKPTEGDRS